MKMRRPIGPRGQRGGIMKSNRQRAQAAKLEGVFMGKQLTAAIQHERDIVSRLTNAVAKAEDETTKAKLQNQLDAHSAILSERIADLAQARDAARN